MVEKHNKMTRRKLPNQEPTLPKWNGYTSNLDYVGYGGSALVFALDQARVVKVDFGSDQSKQDMETERRAYLHIVRATKPSPHVLRCFELSHPRGIVLERCPESVVHRLSTMVKESFPGDAKLKMWAKQATEGLAFLHENEIIHGDVSCRNMLLDLKDNLKLIDFACSSTQGSLSSAQYDWWSRLPSVTQPTIKSDLFALGSTLYHIWNMEAPYIEKKGGEVQELYRQGRFPALKKGTMETIIMRCWKQKYKSASEVAHDIDPLPCPFCEAFEVMEEVPSDAQSISAPSSTASALSIAPVTSLKEKRRSKNAATCRSGPKTLLKALSSNRIFSVFHKTDVEDATINHNHSRDSSKVIEPSRLSRKGDKNNVPVTQKRKTRICYRSR